MEIEGNASDSDIECLTPKTTTITSSKPFENQHKIEDFMDIRIRQQKEELNWARKSNILQSQSSSEKEIIHEKFAQVFQLNRKRVKSGKFRRIRTAVGEDVEKFFTNNPPESEDSDPDEGSTNYKKLIIESHNQIIKEPKYINRINILKWQDSAKNKKTKLHNIDAHTRIQNVNVVKDKVKIFRINPNPNFNNLATSNSIQITNVTTTSKILIPNEEKKTSEASLEPVDELNEGIKGEPEIEIMKEIISKSNYILNSSVTQPNSQLTFPKVNDLKDLNTFVSLGDLLLEDTKLCDVELLLGDHVFRAHKLVLSCQSSYFRELFKNKIEGIPYVLHNSIDVRAFQLTLNFLYSGRFCETVFLNPDSFYAFLYIADKYDIQRLKDYCLTSVHNMLKFEPEFGVRLMELALTRCVASKSFLVTIVNLIKPVYKEMKELPKWKKILSNPEHFFMFQNVAKKLFDS